MNQKLGIPSSDACGIYWLKFICQGRCEDVLTYPLHFNQPLYAYASR